MENTFFKPDLGVIDYLKEITQQLDELKKALNKVPAAIVYLAEALPQNITDKKIEYRNADDIPAEERKEGAVPPAKGRGRKKAVES